MANKDFGVKRIELIGSSGTPNLTSPTNLNLNANTVAISTDVTIGGKVQSDVIVGTGYSVGIGSTLPQQALDVDGTIRANTFVTSDGSPIGAGDTANIVTGIITATTYYGDGSNLTGVAAGVTVSDSPPSPAADNSLWWSSALAKGFIRYNDGDSTQWVEFSPAGGGGGNVVGLDTAGTSYFTDISVSNQSNLTDIYATGISTFFNISAAGFSNVDIGDTNKRFRTAHLTNLYLSGNKSGTLSIGPDAWTFSRLNFSGSYTGAWLDLKTNNNQSCYISTPDNISSAVNITLPGTSPTANSLLVSQDTFGTLKWSNSPILSNINVSGISTFGTSYEVTSGSGTFTASAGVSTNIESFNASDYKVVEYKLWAQHANGIQSQKVIVMHDDNDVYTQESDIFFSNTLLIGAGATISGGTVSLTITPESGVNGITTYRYSKESLV